MNPGPNPPPASSRWQVTIPCDKKQTGARQIDWPLRRYDGSLMAAALVQFVVDRFVTLRGARFAGRSAAQRAKRRFLSGNLIMLQNAPDS